MSLTYKFDKFNENSPQKKEEPNNADGDQAIELYDTPGHARNICFIDENGKHLFLNYSYLVSGEYSPDKGTVILVFTTHSISLTGHNLLTLFQDILQHLPKVIRTVTKRYEVIESSEIFINKISVRNKEE